jgi:hypothetical protein
MRRERRADARAAEELANASHLSTSSIAEEAVDKLEPEKPNETVEEAAAAGNQAEEAKGSEHHCDICENTFKTLKGLKSHKGRMHKTLGSPIPQMTVLVITPLMMKLSAKFAKNAMKRRRPVRISTSM